MQNRIQPSATLKIFTQWLLWMDTNGAKNAWESNTQDILLSLKELAKNLNDTHNEFKQLFLNLIIISFNKNLKLDILIEHPENIKNYPNLLFIKHVFEEILNSLTSVSEMENISYRMNLIELKKRLFHFLNDYRFIRKYLMMFFKTKLSDARFQKQLFFFDLYIAPLFIEKIPSQPKSLSTFIKDLEENNLSEAISTWYQNRNELLIAITDVIKNKKVFDIENLLFAILIANKAERYQKFLYSRFDEIINIINNANIDIAPILQTLYIKFDMAIRDNNPSVSDHLPSTPELEAQQNFVRLRLENLKLPNTSFVYQSTPQQCLFVSELNPWFSDNNLVLEELMQAQDADKSAEFASTPQTTENDKVIAELLELVSSSTSSDYVEPNSQSRVGTSPNDTVATGSDYTTASVANPYPFFTTMNYTPSITNPYKLSEIYKELKKIALVRQPEMISNIAYKYESYKKSIDEELIKTPIFAPGFKLSIENLLICFMLSYKKYRNEYFLKIKPMMDYILNILDLSELNKIKEKFSSLYFESDLLELIDRKTLYHLNKQKEFLLKEISTQHERKTKKIFSTFLSLDDVNEIENYWQENMDELLIILQTLPFYSNDKSDYSLWLVLNHLLSRQTSFNHESLTRILVQLIFCLSPQNLVELNNSNNKDLFFPYIFKARQVLVDFIDHIKLNDPNKLASFFAENKLNILNILPFLPLITNYLEDVKVRYPHQFSVSEILFMLIVTYVETTDAVYERTIEDLLTGLDKPSLELVKRNIATNLSKRSTLSNYINVFSEACSRWEPIHITKNVSVFLTLLDNRLKSLRQNLEPVALLNEQTQNSLSIDATTQQAPKKARVMATERDSTFSPRPC